MALELVTKSSKRLGKALLLPAAFALVWQLMASKPERSFIFVPLTSVVESAVELVLGGDLFWNLMASLRKALLALLLGGIAGLAVGTALSTSRSVDRAFGPLLHAMRQVPGLGLAPLIGLWFGTGELAKIVLIFLAVFYPVLLSTYAGVRSIDPKYLEVAAVFALGKRDTFFKLTLPAILPFLYTGLSQAVAFAWISTVGSEMLLTSGAGIGNLMQQAQAAARMDIVIVCVISVGATSMSIDHLLKRLGRHMTRWQDTAEASA